MKTDEILSVAETPAGVHLLFLSFEEPDIASAIGGVPRYRSRSGRCGRFAF
jgi:hypothetical protein